MAFCKTAVSENIRVRSSFHGSSVQGEDQLLNSGPPTISQRQNNAEKQEVQASGKIACTLYPTSTDTGGVLKNSWIEPVSWRGGVHQVASSRVLAEWWL